MDQDELLVVGLERVWGSPKRSLGRVFRPTNHALGVITALVINKTELHESEMPHVQMSGGRVVFEEGDPIPEGSYVVRADANFLENEAVTLPGNWTLNVSTEDRVGSLLSTPDRSGLFCQASNGTSLSRESMHHGNGAIWITPARHLSALLLPLNTSRAGAHTGRPPFNVTDRYGYTSDVFPNKVLPLFGSVNEIVPGPPADNTFPDGTPFEDWAQYDCALIDILQPQ
jgi:hypothetical protein